MIIVLHCHNNKTFYISFYSDGNDFKDSLQVSSDIQKAYNFNSYEFENIKDMHYLRLLIKQSRHIQLSTDYVYAIEFREAEIKTFN